MVQTRLVIDVEFSSLELAAPDRRTFSGRVGDEPNDVVWSVRGRLVAAFPSQKR